MPILEGRMTFVSHLIINEALVILAMQWCINFFISFIMHILIMWYIIKSLG